MYSCQALLGSPKYHKAKEKDRALLDSYASYAYLDLVEAKFGFQQRKNLQDMAYISSNLSSLVIK
jgi:hypothetical protein